MPIAPLALVALIVAAPALSDSPAHLVQRLPALRGLERARALATLTDADKASNPKQAIAYGLEALAVLKTRTDPPTEVRVLNEMGWATMVTGDYAQAALLVERARTIAERHHDDPGLARACNNLGVIARSRGDFPQAIDLFTRSLELDRRLHDNKNVAGALNNLGFVYGTDLSEYERGLDYHLQALGLRERLKDSEGIALSLNNIGIIYGRLRQYDRALQYLGQALALRRRLGAKNRIASTLSNIGDLELEKGDYAQALAHHLEALGIRREVGEKSGIVISLRTIAEIKRHTGDLAGAQKSLDEAVALASTMDDKPQLVNNLLSVSALARQRGRAADAVASARNALALATGMGAKDSIRRAYEELSAAEETSGDYRAALDAYRKFKESNDAIFNQASEQSMERLRHMYESERSGREIEQLKRVEATQVLQVERQRTQRNALGAVILLIIAGGAVLYRRRVEMAEVARELSVTDSLTGLRNRRWVMQTIDKDIAASLREGFDLVFFVLDLDRFKDVNDRWGHAAGDSVLRQLAAVLVSCCRASDTVARWGGEEFLIIGRFTDRDRAAEQAERVRLAVEGTMFTLPDGIVVRCTCSIGFTSFPFYREAPAHLTWSQVLDVADEMLYAAKHSGRNTWATLRPANGVAPQPSESFKRGAIGALVESGALIADARGPLRWSAEPAA